MGRDLLLAIRHALRQPTFSAAVLITVAIATAITATVGSLVDQVLIRPLPFAHADRVVGVWFSSPNFAGGLTRVRQSKATFEHVRQRTEVFEDVALAEETALTLDLGDRSARIRAAQVTAGIFNVLGVTVDIGRNLTDADSAPGANRVVVISEATWRARFGADRQILDRDIRLDGVPHRVVGVLGAGVRFPVQQTELWVPLTIDPADLGDQDFVYTGYGLVKPGVGHDQLHADMLRLIDQLPDAYPRTFPRPLITRLKLTGLFVPLLEEMVGQVRRPLLYTLAATVAVLFAVFANLTNLFLMRHESRRQEMAIRAAVGAHTLQLARLVVAETVTLAVAGGVMGLVLATAGISWVREVAVGVLPRASELTVGPVTASICLALTAALGLLVGLATARQSRARDMEALRDGGRVESTRRGTRVRWVLVGAQVALSVVVATGAGLLLRSVAALGAVDPGFTADGLGGARLFVPATDYPTFAAVSGFYRGLLDDLRATPQVEAAAVVSYLPLRDGRIFNPYTVENDTRDNPLPTPRQTKLVFDGYFETMRIPLIEGRWLERRDVESTSDAVVVNAAFARAYWPTGSAIGKRLRSDTTGPWLSVIGVVGNELDRSLTDSPPPIAYLPYQARHSIDRRLREMSVVVRSRTAAETLPIIQSGVNERDRSVPVFAAQSMNEVLAAATARTRYAMRLVTAFACAALFLAAIGLYAVLSNTVANRKNEIAIRMALGASGADIRRLLLMRVAVTFFVGGSAGAVLAGLSAQLAHGLLFGVRPVDPLTIGLVAVLVAGAGTLATIVPARRAIAATPATVLRA